MKTKDEWLFGRRAISEMIENKGGKFAEKETERAGAGLSQERVARILLNVNT